jgi:MFS family permease
VAGQHSRPSNGRLDGPIGWIAASAGCLLNAWTFGVFYSFGAAFKQMAGEFGASTTAIATMFAITTFWFFALGIVTGPLADRYGPRPLMLAGAVFMGSGFILTSYIQSISVGYLTYGLGVGTGVGLYLVPLTSTISGWFDKQRASALGLATGGIGLGTLLLVPLAVWFINSEGWRHAFRVMGIGSVIVFVLSAMAMRRSPVPPAPFAVARRAIKRAVSQVEFWRLYVSGLFMSLALFVPFVLMIRYAEDRGITGTKAAMLIGMLGAGSVVGRFGVGFLGSRVGVFPMVVASFAVQPPAYAIWLASGSFYPGLILFTVLLGIGYGGYVALSPVAAAEIFGLEGLGGVLGVMFTSAGIGALGGTIGLGLVIDAAGFEPAIIISIVLSAMGALTAWPLRHAGARQRRRTSGMDPLVFILVPVPELASPEMTLSR